jgi:hypothetical protein
MFNFLTDKDYKIISDKFADLWEEVQELKRRVRELEDAERDRSSLVDVADLRPGDSVAAWDSSKKQWRSGHVNELYGLMALVVTDDGDCFMASKARRL